jgi:hypothetical protein
MHASLDQENDAMHCHSTLFPSLDLVSLLRRLCLACLFISSLAHADFDDRGLLAGRVRSSYEPGMGSGSQWLTLWYATPGTGCRFDARDPVNPFGCPGWFARDAYGRDAELWRGNLQGQPACGGDATPIGDSWIGCISYGASPYFALNRPLDQYWVVVANSDPSFNQCNDGPPGLSHRITNPIADATPNLYKVAMEDLPTGAKRAHLILNASEHDFRCRTNSSRANFIQPFLSLGAQQGHGQAGPVAMLNRSKSRYPGAVNWTSRIYAYQPFSCKPGEACGNTGVQAGFYAITSWNGINRLLFVNLLVDGAMASQGDPAIRAKWNWPVLESFYYPGAEMVVFNTDSLRRNRSDRGCGIDLPALPRDGREQAYRVDVSALFACASDLGLFSDAMPTGELPLNGFHWYMESVGSAGWLWLAFEQPRVE